MLDINAYKWYFPICKGYNVDICIFQDIRAQDDLQASLISCTRGALGSSPLLCLLYLVPAVLPNMHSASSSFRTKEYAKYNKWIKMTGKSAKCSLVGLIIILVKGRKYRPPSNDFIINPSRARKLAMTRWSCSKTANWYKMDAHWIRRGITPPRTFTNNFRREKVIRVPDLNFEKKPQKIGPTHVTGVTIPFFIDAATSAHTFRSETGIHLYMYCAP